MALKYTAFISHRHLPLDMAVAKTLHRKIERYRVPKDLRKTPGQKKLGVVFRDREELPLSNDLTQDIYAALDKSDFLIVICTPDTPKSLWVDREIEHFLQTHDRKQVLTVLAAGTPEESIPPRITHIYGPDGTLIDRKEPLCAFIVADQTWKVLWNLRGEFQRLVAAILGKPLDAIRQRARAYRWKLIGSIMAMITAVTLGFVGMLVSKNQQIREQLLLAQLNESKTLTLISQNQLEDGNRVGALESALSALPSPGNERPYYAPAETALEKALYLYEWPRYQAQALIAEPSGLSKMTLSDDGKYAACLTGSGSIACYEMSTQQLLWERSGLDDFGIESLEFQEAQGTLLYTSSGGGQFVLDALTGQLLLSCDLSSRICPEDFTQDERYVALIDGEHAVFFDTRTGDTVRSDTIDRGEYTQAACGGYCADEKSFLIVYTGVFDGDRQLRAAVIDTQNGTILFNTCLDTGLSENIYDERIIGLEDGSFFVTFCYEDARYFFRLSAEAEVLAENGYWLPENDFVRGSLRERIQLIDGMVCIVENGQFRSVDPKTCQVLSEHTNFGSGEYCRMFADGSLLYKNNNQQLVIYQLSENGQLRTVREQPFSWSFSYVYGSVHNSDTFLAQTQDNTKLLIVRKLGCLGTEAVKAEMLPLTLSGNLIYLPKFCGIYCSPDSETVYFTDIGMGTDGTGGNTHTLYHTATGQTETVAPLDIPDYTGIRSYDGSIPEAIGQEAYMTAVTAAGDLAAFAVGDTLYLYDPETQTVHFQVPQIAYCCQSITFLQDGRFVMVGNIGQYTVVDTATGETVGQFEAGYSPSDHNDHHTQIRESADGKHLYICSSIAEFDGAIVETESWTVLHHVDGLVGYLPATDTLVYVSNDYTSVYLQPHLHTAELIDLGNQILSGS